MQIRTTVLPQVRPEITRWAQRDSNPRLPPCKGGMRSSHLPRSDSESEGRRKQLRHAFGKAVAGLLFPQLAPLLVDGFSDRAVLAGTDEK